MKKVFNICVICLNALSLFHLGDIQAKEVVDIKGNGQIVTKEIHISEYTEIKVGGNINNENVSFFTSKKKPEFNYSQTPDPSSLRITTDENLFSHLNIRVSGNCLIVSIKDNERIFPTRFDINSHSMKLEKAKINGNFQFTIQTELNVEKLELEINGAANLDCNGPIIINNSCIIQITGAGNMKTKNITCQNMEVKVNGVGNLKLKGKAKTAKYHVKEDGSLEGYNFIVENLKCRVSGSGNIYAHTTEILEANAVEAGKIKYKGLPRTNIQCSGAGNIKRVK